MLYTRSRLPELGVMWIHFEPGPNTLDDAALVKLEGLSLNYRSLSMDLVSQAHARKLKVYGWGGDLARFWRQAFLCKADGVYADAPDRARNYLEYLAQESDKAESAALWKK